MKKILVIILLFFPLCIYAQSDALIKFNDLKEITEESDLDLDQALILKYMHAVDAYVYNDSIRSKDDLGNYIMVMFFSNEDFFKLSNINGVKSFTNSNILYDDPFFVNGVPVQKIMIRKDWYMNLEDDIIVMNDILNYVKNSKFMEFLN